jgi:hypothetical protein
MARERWRGRRGESMWGWWEPKEAGEGEHNTRCSGGETEKGERKTKEGRRVGGASRCGEEREGGSVMKKDVG